MSFKVEFNDEVVGFIILQITDEANVVSIAVKKGYRNLGLATKLFKHAEEYVQSKGIKVVSLEVAFNNITAYLLYKKLGFTQRRIRKNYYENKIDCIEMIKEID